MRVLLFDADIVAYKVSTLAQDTYTSFASGGEDVTLADASRAERHAQLIISKLQRELEADEVIICLSDPKHNFRKTLDPSYKASRGVQKPVLLGHIKSFLQKSYTSRVAPTLEADDVMGILATSPTETREMIIVSEDKDMRTLPTRVYNPDHPQLGIQEVSALEAARFHCWQTIVGDKTDNYPGARGVGPRDHWAEEVLEASLDELWDLVLHAYAAVNLTEDDAIHQARLARILRHADYDFTTKAPRLWEPHSLYF